MSTQQRAQPPRAPSLVVVERVFGLNIHSRLFQIVSGVFRDFGNEYAPGIAQSIITALSKALSERSLRVSELTVLSDGNSRLFKLVVSDGSKSFGLFLCPDRAFYSSARGRSSHSWHTLYSEPSKIGELLDAPDKFARYGMRGFDVLTDTVPLFGTI